MGLTIGADEAAFDSASILKPHIPHARNAVGHKAFDVGA
jgi:hypothetical protein